MERDWAVLSFLGMAALHRNMRAPQCCGDLLSAAAVALPITLRGDLVDLLSVAQRAPSQLFRRMEPIFLR